jgi:hypothetical protein
VAAFADLLGSLFTDPDFSRGATYTMPEGGPPVACRVVFRTEHTVDAVADMQVRRNGRLLQIRKSDIALPKERGLVVFATGEPWRITGAPWSDDPQQLVWTMIVVPVS